MIPKTMEEKLKSLSRNGTVRITSMAHERGFAMTFYAKTYKDTTIEAEVHLSAISGHTLEQLVIEAYACSDRFSIDRWGKVLTEYGARRNGRI
jgi:hypothetical protein